MQAKRLMITPLVAAIAAAFTLAACGQREDSAQNQPTVGQQIDSAVANAERRADEMKADASQGMDKAKDAVAGAAADLKAGAGQAVDATTNAVKDAAITASINAELAKDPALSALKIDVDTQAGQVALRGSAPDAAARDRATQLAAAVDGVVSVDNQLAIGKS